MTADNAPAHFRWLPPQLRPPAAMQWRQEKIFLLVGAAAFFAGYNENVYGFAIPQIQASLHIPENQIGLTVSYFRLAALLALLIAASADLVGRRRLLLVTLFGQGFFTLLTAFTPDYVSFVWAQGLTRVFGYAEEMLCFVVIAEEVAAGARGWANGTISSLYYLGAGIASLMFAMITLLPFGWRSLYAIGAVAIFLVAFLRRQLPETRRYVEQVQLRRTTSRLRETMTLLRDMARQYPMRILTILIVAATFGFATSSATVLQSKYLQTVYHYRPWQASAISVPGGLIGLALTIFAGRMSDRLGRKPVAFAIICLSALCFLLFYGGAPSWSIPILWILAFFGFFSGDALVAGFALEIVPTEYRSTVSGLRYVVEIGAGALSLALEGHLYDHFHAHGPAIQLLLAPVLITLFAIPFLPEPAGKTLEEVAKL
jgi:MFS family permease